MGKYPAQAGDGAEMTRTLGIETCCDETSVAFVEDGRRVVSNVIHSQVDLHREFGGVVPELAARDHLERLPHLLDMALEKAGVRTDGLDLLAVTRGPGLVGCLLVGVGVGEGLAAAWSKPLTGVNHLWGHIYAAMLTRPDLEPPLLGLVVSGAHSDLVRMPEHGRFEVIGRTRDDAAGEAFDKAARMLGLGFPGGPALDHIARTGDPDRRPLPKPSLPGLEYSFSGLKTALLYRLRGMGESVTNQDRADLAAAFEQSVVESLLEKLDLALGDRKSTRLNSSHLVISYAVFCLETKKKLLARRRAPPDAAAHLWHRLVHQGGPRGLPAAAAQGTEAPTPRAGGAGSLCID